MEPYFLFSLVWSIGCTTDGEGRNKFDKFFRNLLKEKKSKYQFPDYGTIYDYEFRVSAKKYVV